LAKVATVLSDVGISIDRMRQYGEHDTDVPVLIVTHKAARNSLDAALAKLDQLDVVVGQPVALRIEDV
jgi:homoserine dehydrogenase